ncbi:MAG: ATP-binding protein [Candidatus Micrarchaeia archaeon]
MLYLNYLYEKLKYLKKKRTSTTLVLGTKKKVLGKKLVLDPYCQSRGSISYLTSWKPAFGNFKFDPAKEINPHLLIAGTSGAGKSSLLKSLMLSISEAGISLLLLDTESEHSKTVEQIGGKVYSASRGGLNLFSLDGLSVSQRIEHISGLLKLVFGLGYIQSFKLSECLWYTYRKAGASTKEDKNIANIPSGSDLMKEISIFIKNSKSATERNMLEHLSGKIRIVSGLISSSSSIDIERILNGINSISLAELKTSEERYIFLNETLDKIYNKMHERAQTHRLGLYIIIDEIESFVKSSNGKSIITSIIEEGRKYGIGTILVTHSVSGMDKEVAANASTFVIFKTTEPTELNYVTNLLSNSEAERKVLSEKIRSLKPGYAIARTSSSKTYEIRARTPQLQQCLEAKDLQYASPASSSTGVYAGNNLAMKDEGSESIAHIKNPSLEHEARLSLIAECFRRNSIKFYFLRNGPDIVAFYNSKRIAIEYETGRKSFLATRKMLESRTGYEMVIVVVNDAFASRYKMLASSYIKVVPFSKFDCNKFLKYF